MDPITITVAEARKVLSIGNTKLYELIDEGRLRTVKLGRRTLVLTESIRCLVEALETA
jgi:excisionase family DNA binding protein